MEMLKSLALIFLLGMFLSGIMGKCRLPGLLGMLLTGILLGSTVPGQLDPTLLAISPQLRQMAFLIILIRAGLSLNVEELRKVGRPALLMCFVPACFEIIGMMCLAPKLLSLSLLDAAILGTVIGAVSPAVIVPKMLGLMDEGYGVKQGIPQLILAGASVDDVFVIVLFTVCTGMAQGNGFSPLSLAQIPLSMLTGIGIGAAVGWLWGVIFTRLSVRDSAKVLLILSCAFLFSYLENALEGFPFSAALAVLAMGIALRKKRKETSKRLSSKFSKLWVGAEILLFVLVGACVNVRYVGQAGLSVLLLLAGVLLFRALGVGVCLAGTSLTWKERIFCAIAYLPKATVQAAIGPIPLALGLSCGQTVLTVAVIAILLTAPLGALGIDLSHAKLLGRELPSQPPEGC